MHSNRLILVLGLLAGPLSMVPVPAVHAQSGADPGAAPQGHVIPPPAPALTPIERRVVARVDARAEEAVRFLERVVDINSGTGNAGGVRTSGEAFRSTLDSLGFHTRWVELPAEMRRAGHLLAERSGSRGQRVLLIGHLDTVYELDHPFQRFTRQDPFAHGPGVIDAKGGAVVLLYALWALSDAGVLDGAGITVALTGDEEQPGVPYEQSRAALLAAARASDVALAFEPAADDISHATPVRLGFSDWTLRVITPRYPGEAARIPQAAMGVAMSLVQRFQPEEEDEYLSVFPLGLASDSVLVVTGGVRFASWEQLEGVKARMSEVARASKDAKTELSFGTDPYPGMPPRSESFALLDTLSAISVALGSGPVGAGDPHRRGGGDISFVGHLIPGLDGLGPAGNGAHSEQETVDLGSLTLATKRAALLIHRLTRE